MPPGEYLADATEGITRVEDLPKPLVVQRCRNYRRRPCPHCGRSCYRDKRGQRRLHDLGCLQRNRPRELRVVYSRHRCETCRRYFSADLSDLAAPGSHYTQRVTALAVRLVIEDNLPYRLASWHLWRDHRVFVPFATIQNWVEAAEKKASVQADTNYLDWALTDFSGYLAVDELYDGPFCVLSAVDARQQRRLRYEVLDHDPTQADILWFLARLDQQLTARSYAVLGITTDGSTLYPLPLALLFPDVPHQICVFHILKELTTVVLRCVARVRKALAAQVPQRPRGRPPQTLATDQPQRQAQLLHRRVAELFEHRHLFVRHHLTPGQRQLLQRLTRQQPHLRALRAIMDEVYRLFDRRCRTETALAKLAQLRQRVRRFRALGRSLDKLKSPNLDKALTFLDDRLLAATSNAVERSNRRVRKMQKSVYGVRQRESLQGRLALDLQRDQQAEGRIETLTSLHDARRQPE